MTSPGKSKQARPTLPANGRPYLMTSQEAADYLRVSLRQLKRWVAEGRIPVRRIADRVIRFRAVDLEAFADRHEVGR